MKDIFYLEGFGKAFIPESIRPNLRRYLLKAGINEVPYQLFGAMFYLSIILTYIPYMLKVFPFLQSQHLNILIFAMITVILWFLMQAAITGLLMIMVYSYLDMMIFNRTKKIEDVLDDFLGLVSENLKGGMSLDQALWQSVQPEFDILAGEIQIVAKKVATGEDVEQAIVEFTEKYDSPMTRRAFDLIVEGLRGGADIAALIDKVVDSITDMKMIKEEMVAANMTYVIFITAIVIVIAPALFALSKQMLVILIGFTSKVGPALSQGTASMPLNIGKISINLDDFVLFSRLAISIVAVCSSLIIAEINRGNMKSGIKYLPVFVAASLIAYTIFSFILGAAFGSFI